MRGASVLLSCCLLVLACTGGPPTPSEAPTTSPEPSSSARSTATVAPTPRVGPTTDTGLPTSILGLPVYTVAGTNRLAATGALDGRFGAVAGYWNQLFLPCAFMPHSPPVLGFCNGGRFADTPEELQTSSDLPSAPLALMEASGGVPCPVVGPVAGPCATVGLIVHARDSRSWQCAQADRATCLSHLVIDGVAWVNGQPTVIGVQPDASNTPGDLHLSLDQVTAAAVQPGQTLVLELALEATHLNDLDPRFAGLADGIVWYVRVISGPPGDDSTAPGMDVLVDDASGTVIASMPLEVDAAYDPARVVLDASGWEGPVGNPSFTVSRGTTVVVAGQLGAQTAPLVLDAGDYSVHAFIETPQANPVAGPTCDLPLTVAAGDDVAYYADFGTATDCTWKAGTWPFQ